MRVVRSANAHGVLKSVDLTAALAAPGVVAAWRAADIPDVPFVDFREGPIEALQPFRQPVLALDRVRYVGEPIAVVFAEDPYLAEDAAELVCAEIEALPVVMDAAGAPAEFESGRSTEIAVVKRSYGDLAEAFRSAACIVELDLTIGRHSGVPLETRGAVARYIAATDTLELHGAAKVPHKNRETIARVFQRPLASVHLFEWHVGGGFGVRGEIYPEDLLVCAGALRLGRPVKWIEDRREHLVAASHSRQQRHRVKAAVAEDGRILGIDDEFFHDQGAYLRTHAVRVVNFTCAQLPGPYRVPAYRGVGRVRLTNKTPAATYRAPGRYESTFVRERLLDAIAHRLGLDRIEIRRRNLIARAEMPYDRVLDGPGENNHFDTGDYAGLLDKALAAVHWTALQDRLRALRAAGESIGAGLSVFVETTGLGPRDGVEVTVEPTGHVEVVTGGSSVGQGFETVMAQICAEALGVDYRKVRVVRGRTDRIEHGIGAHASRATVMTGNATFVAAGKVRDKALEMAAELMQAPVDLLEIEDGAVRRSDQRWGPSLTLAEIAQALSPNSKTLGTRDPGLSAKGWFHSERQVYPYGVHIAVVSVDRDTGAAKVERYLAALDVGRAINPMLVEGQVHGGVVQGVGGALFEEFVYSESGEPLSVTLADYLLPSLQEAPLIETLICEDEPTDRNPLGAKGAGENGISGVGAAIASALDDALGLPGAVTELPVTPARIRRLLAEN